MSIVFTTALPSLWLWRATLPIAEAMEWDALRTDATANLASFFNGVAAFVGLLVDAAGFASETRRPR